MSDKKVGRPTDYSFELAKEICRAIARSNKGLRKLCKENDHFPSSATVFEWRIEHKEFADIYARAKAAQVEVFVDEIIEIADNSSKDITMNEDGKLITNLDHINRCRLRIDTRKWIAGKLAPRIYGDKISIDESVYDDGIKAVRELINKCSQQKE